LRAPGARVVRAAGMKRRRRISSFSFCICLAKEPTTNKCRLDSRRRGSCGLRRAVLFSGFSPAFLMLFLCFSSSFLLLFFSFSPSFLLLFLGLEREEKEKKRKRKAKKRRKKKTPPPCRQGRQGRQDHQELEGHPRLGLRGAEPGESHRERHQDRRPDESDTSPGSRI
jgi:hypothetical protein